MDHIRSLHAWIHIKTTFRILSPIACVKNHPRTPNTPCSSYLHMRKPSLNEPSRQHLQLIGEAGGAVGVGVSAICAGEGRQEAVVYLSGKNLG